MNASALEKQVIDALIHRGRSDAEAKMIVQQLKKAASNPFANVTDMELSPDGKYLAIANVTAIALAPSGKALLCEWPGEAGQWIPIRQIVTAMTEVDSAGDVGTLVITRWIAEKKGFVTANGTIHKSTTKTP